MEFTIIVAAVPSKGDHESMPRNVLIAKVFFMAGYIESWGRGINLIYQACNDYGIPEPTLEQEAGGLRLTFLKDIYTEENLKKLNINDRQRKPLLYVKENGQITNAQYRALYSISKPAATLDLQDLVSKLHLIKTGTTYTGRGSFYQLYIMG